MGVRRFIICCILLSSLLCGCAPKAWTVEDPWYSLPPKELRKLSEWEKLDESRYREVLASKMPEAEALLQDVSYVELTEQQAADLVDKPLADIPGTKPYLVRGVYLNRITGRFFIYRLGDRVRVHHGSTGKKAVPMKRQALVVRLEQPPQELYVTCSMIR